MITETEVIRVPASFESEQAVVGALLLDNTAFDRISDRMQPEHFFSHDCRMVFAEIARQLAAGKAADVLTVGQALEHEITLERLNDLAAYVPSTANLQRHAQIVIDMARSRQLMTAADEISELAFDKARDIDERLEAAQATLAKLQQDAPRDEWVAAYDGMIQHSTLLEQRAAGTIKSWGTGLADLDDMLEGGLRPGALVVIGARPSHGKSALGMSVGLHMASDYAVALMSMEMPHRDIRDRMTAMLGRVPLSAVIRPNAGAGLEWDRVIEGTEAAKRLNFYVTDQPGLNINQVRAKARGLKRLHGLNVLVIDYIGLMRGLDSKQSRAYQIEEITKGLKELAKDLDIVVVALSQLNRDIEKRVNRRPMLSDFRDSGSIEQDADIVLGLHREAVDKPDLDGEWNNYAELHVLKNRQGRIGKVNLFYEGAQVRFTGWGGPPPQRATMTRTKRGFQTEEAF